MCNCIKEIEVRVLNHLRNKNEYKKPIESVRMEGMGFLMGDSISMNTKTNFIITLTGQKKKHTVPVFHSYCPFCGEKTNLA